MSVSDVADWTRPIVIVNVSMAATDFPDWTEAIQIATAAGTAYASLTGAGVSTTPGDLTQAGGLEVDASSGHPIKLNATNGETVIQSTNVSVEVGEVAGPGGFYVDSKRGVYLLAESGTLVTLESSGGGGVWCYPHGGGLNVAGGDFITIGNNTGTPATPSGAGRLFVQGGALKYVGSSGTVTTIAPA